ncbi:DUF421 domain-containing protein [Aquabacter spiritensis]|uniref:Uncharacterized membrane protein YcaP (DUF421 family) n=1 Tax=Aquabacter spiritensis TaxID=933073 RepID=A0A4R3LY42_9HYPH|nr:YetF domain-containing protein [Aquabacter spiritensis]TCT05580.1 uncharacterized membrane protein YcaP (DUF421 family) [Aquabacter spiritensis]
MDIASMLFQGWPGLVRTLLVGILAYVTLVAFLRLSGKRTLAKLNAFDLVVTVALGSTLATILLQESVALAEGALCLALLIGMQFAVSFFSVRSPAFAHAVRSEPALLVRDGRFCAGAMRRERITEGEALSAVRAAGGQAIAEARSVILESDGTLSVALRPPDGGAPGEPRPTRLEPVGPA